MWIVACHTVSVAASGAKLVIAVAAATLFLASCSVFALKLVVNSISDTQTHKEDRRRAEALASDPAVRLSVPGTLAVAKEPAAIPGSRSFGTPNETTVDRRWYITGDLTVVLTTTVREIVKAGWTPSRLDCASEGPVRWSFGAGKLYKSFGADLTLVVFDKGQPRIRGGPAPWPILQVELSAPYSEQHDGLPTTEPPTTDRQRADLQVPPQCPPAIRDAVQMLRPQS